MFDINKKYHIILADPPWKYDDELQSNPAFGGITYKTMEVGEICALPIKNIAENDSILFLWTTAPLLEKSFEVISSWGFEYKTVGFCWVKINDDGSYRTGIGKYTNSNIELCLIAKRGSIERVQTNIKQIISARVTEHSAKPKEVYSRIEKLYGNISRIELFARHKRQGWDCWGNEVPELTQTLLEIPEGVEI